MVKHRQRRAGDPAPTFMDILLDLRQDPILQAMFGEKLFFIEKLFFDCWIICVFGHWVIGLFGNLIIGLAGYWCIV